MPAVPARKKDRNLLGLVISALVVVLAPIAGAGITVLLLRGAFHEVEGPAVDPSQKARVLAEGISAAMNGAAGGLIVSCLALVGVVLFAVRLARGPKPLGA